MLPMSQYSPALQGYQQNPYGMMPATPMQQFSQFAATGIGTLDGTGYAYTPGSEMTKFMDDINNKVALATRAPDGVSSVVDWANGLAQQAALRKQQQQALMAQQMGAMQSFMGGSSAGGATSAQQMMQMLLSMLMSKLQGQG
ncbi:MAG: hypothetical protein K0Q50_2032 [Vampirovibrio sp.]|jgi:hypothetical protein|nr:hypothetical protein [Vampirovibrio sp.]